VIFDVAKRNKTIMPVYTTIVKKDNKLWNSVNSWLNNVKISCAGKELKTKYVF